MLFVICAWDGIDGKTKRKAYYPSHTAYLTGAATQYGVKVLLAGPLVEDDAETPLGSLFVVDAPDRTTVESFHAADPFSVHEVWTKRSITAFLKRRG